MPSLHYYSCKECGCSFAANGSGYDIMFCGFVFYYSCPNCKEIGSISERFDIVDSLRDKDRMSIKSIHRSLVEKSSCRNCGYKDIKVWTYKCGCPECGGKLDRSTIKNCCYD